MPALGARKDYARWQRLQEMTLRPACPTYRRGTDACSCAEGPAAMIRSPIAQFQCLFAQPWSQVFGYLSGPLRYNRLHEITDQERGMRQIPSLDGPLKA